MRRKGISFLLSLAVAAGLFLSDTCNATVQAADNFQSLNPIIEVTGKDIYVQHYTSDDPSDTTIHDTYDVTKSGTGTTTIYKLILPNFTVNKAWTREGAYIDNVCVRADDPSTFISHSATAPQDYIPVSAGEEYFIRTYGVGGVKVGENQYIYYAPVLFLDEDENVIEDVLTGTFGKSKTGVTITVPEGATRMHITMYGNQNFSLQKVMQVTDEQFDQLIINKTALLDDINEKYDAYLEDPVLYKKLDKAYITFVNDDSRWQMDQYADLFLKKDVPLCLAVVPEALIENASNQQETRLEVVRRVVAAGGEVLAHNAEPLTEEGFADYSTMYSYFVKTKLFFNYYDLDVNGIILAGGNGQVTDSPKSERWVSSLFSYSDLYGVPYENKDICTDSVYNHRRGGFYEFQGDVEKMKAKVDSAIANKSWQIFTFHDSSDVSLENLEALLDYILTKSSDEVELVTYKDMYLKFAERESALKTVPSTYYVSATGTSETGLSSEDPMSFETAAQKNYISGDTILFKRGDTFYSSFTPKISASSDKPVTISSYGEGELPTFCGYKIVDSASSWHLHSDGIYKIDLTDTTAFSGLKTTDENSCCIGFLEDANGKKYYRLFSSLELEEEYDFYCDGTYLYMKCSDNPYNKLGTLKLATRTNMIGLNSNMRVNHIRVCGTGAHGILGATQNTDNVIVSNCIIEDIGGCFLRGRGATRYGNGIEFYGTNASNIIVKNNIIRNVYDVAFTIQGTSGSGKNVTVTNNFFANNTQDSEIWETADATGVCNYQFTNNISVNQGRGWGYDARTDKYVAGHILFWAYGIEGDTDIYFHHNIVYNPRRLYFIEQSNKTNIYFKEKDYIKSDYNTYLLTEEARLFRDTYTIHEKDAFIAEYRKDAHSVFTLIEVDDSIVNTAATCNDIKTVNALFKAVDDAEYNDEETTPSVPGGEDPAPSVDIDPASPTTPEEPTGGSNTETETSKKTDTDSHTHVAGGWETTEEPTGDTEGMQVKKCTVCGEVMEAETIPVYTVSFNVTGTIPLQRKKSTAAIKAVTMEGDAVLSYQSSNPSIASVNSNGKITGKKVGTATITVTTKKGATASITVKVQKKSVKTTKIAVSKKKVTLKVGKTYKLTVTKTPVTSLQKVTYKSSDETIATVTKKGKIEALKRGTAKITVKCGTKKKVVKVTVK